ncbi:potassium transporter TrkG, partial [Arthrospira platensis SPKY2]
ITLLFAFFLALAGTGIMLLDRRVHDTVMAGFSTGEQIAVSLFTVIAARTAGLTILPVDQLSEATQFVLMLWMFIGGAPASMAGGISSSAAGVLIIAVVATIRGHPEAVFAGRTLPRETIRK